MLIYCGLCPNQRIQANRNRMDGVVLLLDVEGGACEQFVAFSWPHANCITTILMKLSKAKSWEITGTVYQPP